MTRNPSKLVLAMAVLLAVWVAVFWLYKPRLSEASGADGAGGGGISFGQPPDVARALVATDPVVLPRERPQPISALPVASLPGQELPAPAPQPGGRRLVAPQFSEYLVQRGDSSFAAVSRRVYGTGVHADAISRANPFVTPDKLVAGKTRLRIPKDPANIQGKVEEAAPQTPPPAADTGTASGGATHAVLPGETLGAISKRYYGTTARWKAILDANADVLDKPERLRTGMTLRIPPKD